MPRVEMHSDLAADLRVIFVIETAQEWLGHTSTAHTRAHIDAEDYREKANGVVAELDIWVCHSGR